MTASASAVASREPLAPAASPGERRKALGAFYTPTHLAQAIADWAIRAPQDRILDPAAGEAVFLAAAADRLRAFGCGDSSCQIFGVEIDRDAREKSQATLFEQSCSSQIELNDFFRVAPEHLGGLFNVVIGNPPYIRYHRFNGETRRRALEAAAAAGVRLSRLTSSWAPFLVHAASFLAPGGRLGLVLPAELLHVDYAAPIREFLLRRFASVTVVTFEQAVFPGAMIDAVILLAEDGTTPQGLRILKLADAKELRFSLRGLFTANPAERWSVLRAPSGGVQALERLRAEQKLAPLSAVASVDIGCVTGANDFFILTKQEAARHRLRSGVLRPVIARPSQLIGAVVRAADVKRLSETERCLLLRLRQPGLENSSSALSKYLKRGRDLGIHGRYKCRMRDPWYAVPGLRIPDAFMSYMSHRAPRVALNRARLSSTNLVHRISFHPRSRPWAPAYIAAMYSSLALLSYELEGRSYGGGVLKLETREAERVELPGLDRPLALALRTVLSHIDEAVRRGHPDLATKLVDDVLLAHEVLDEQTLEAIRSARTELEERRALRGRTSA